MATNAISDTLRPKESPARGQRKVVQKDQLRYSRSLFNWVVYLKILIRENLFYVNLENWDRHSPSNSPNTSTRPDEREFVVESGTSMHKMRKKNEAQKRWTQWKRSTTPTVVLTANGEVHTHEEAQVFVHDLNLFVTVHLLEETPAVLSLGNLFGDHGYSYEVVSGQKPRLTKDGKSLIC